MPHYVKGISWFLLVSLVSALNDALIKVMGCRLSGIQITFLRFFFSFITLMPLMLRGGLRNFITPYWKIHAFRSLFLFLALVPWCYGVIALPLPLVTTLSFSTPLFVLILSRIFLKEKLDKARIAATCVGFAGVLVSGGTLHLGWGNAAFLLMLSTLLFASLDVMNKKLLIKNESLLSLLFFSALGTTVLSAPFAALDWQMPQAHEWLLMLILGIGANLILYCLLRAFQYADLSALQPFRYAELLISGGLSLALFGVMPNQSTLLGAMLIIPATLYITRAEVKKQHKKKETSVGAATA